MDKIRLFIAILLPEEVRAEIAKAQAQLRQALAECRISWTRREQFHLTLKFLGDVEKQHVPSLTNAVRAVSCGFGPLHARAEQIGFFPDARSPRVVWVKVNDKQDQLSRLQNAVGLATREFTTEQSERKFSGHVTLARIKMINRAETKVLTDQVSSVSTRFFGEWTADHIEIMRSELLAEGARHTSLASIPLRS